MLCYAADAYIGDQVYVGTVGNKSNLEIYELILKIIIQETTT
jgi:hypothetical protein